MSNPQLTATNRATAYTDFYFVAPSKFPLKVAAKASKFPLKVAAKARLRVQIFLKFCVSVVHTLNIFILISRPTDWEK